MNLDRKSNAAAWHGDKPYSSDERLRLSRACDFFREHAERLGLSRRYRLLDIGCGVGPLREHLPAEKFEIVGMEINAQAAALARRQYNDCRVADVAGDWPFPPKSFDGVHAGAILEHVQDWHGPLNNTNCVLTERGRLVVSVPNLSYWKEIRRLIRGRQPHWLKSMTHVHGYTLGFLRQLIELHGFAVRHVEADRVRLPLLPDWSWVKRRLARFGSVLVVSAELTRRVRVEDDSRAGLFPNHKPLPLRSIEVLES
jgi:cyclopropane fatty-acyl-phospholipid synthase-like methyltransferase